MIPGSIWTSLHSIGKRVILARTAASSSDSEIDHLEFYDILGNPIKKRPVNHSQYEFRLDSEVSPGTYMLVLQLENSTVLKKVVGQH